MQRLVSDPIALTPEISDRKSLTLGMTSNYGHISFKHVVIYTLVYTVNVSPIGKAKARNLETSHNKRVLKLSATYA